MVVCQSGGRPGAGWLPRSLHWLAFSEAADHAQTGPHKVQDAGHCSAGVPEDWLRFYIPLDTK